MTFQQSDQQTIAALLASCKAMRREIEDDYAEERLLCTVIGELTPRLDRLTRLRQQADAAIRRAEGRSGE